MGDKAQFGTLEIAPGAAVTDDTGNKKYMGAERRRDNRRQQQDRRIDVRFEPSKEDRRQNPGRREDDSVATFW
jgi:hypothetical protein